MERIIKESDFSVCFVYPPCLFYKVLIGDWDSVTRWIVIAIIKATHSVKIKLTHVRVSKKPFYHTSLRACPSRI